MHRAPPPVNHLLAVLESLLRLLAAVLAAAVVAQLRALFSGEAGGWRWRSGAGPGEE